MNAQNNPTPVLPLSALLVCLPLAVHAQPITTQDQAAKTFQRFSQALASGPQSAVAAVNTRGPLSANVTYHEADKAPDDPTNQDAISTILNHPHGYWHIEQRGKSDMEVDATTGSVVSYSDYAALDVNGESPAGEATPKADAIRVSRSALNATGRDLSNLSFGYAQERQDSDPPKARSHKWLVYWGRAYRGIPYRRDGASVFLNAETGKVLSVSFASPSIDPPVTNENVTREQALRIAETQLNAVGLDVAALPIVMAKKEIVPVNHFWESGRDFPPSLQTRVVWNCHYGIPLDTLEVWVDAATGDVVGGTRVGVLGRGKKIPALKFGHQLGHANTNPRKK